MNIWIDLSTGPQVLFMRPIISELRYRGHKLLITTRDFTETVSLANQYHLEHTIVGAHGGRTMLGKLAAQLRRSFVLGRLAQRFGANLALGGSYSQALASPFLRIPHVVCGDYEGNPANHLSMRLAKRIIVPNVFHKPNLLRYGATLDKIVSYGGIKENLYLADFVPDPRFLEKASIPGDMILATMRPPSEVSSYHRFKNPLFDELLLWASSHPELIIVLLPRGQEQRLLYEAMHLINVIIPKEVLDGPNLVYHSDLVIGAGGTMNREATVLGTPVYTIFKGMLGSVDQYLINSGKMVRIETSSDFVKIDLRKKTFLNNASWNQGKNLASEVVDEILEVCPL